MSFFTFLAEGKLVTKEEIEQRIKAETEEKIDFHITIEDYLLGISDLSGELMRFATNSAASGDRQTPEQVCQFLQEMFAYCQRIYVPNRDYPMKVEAFEQSVRKVETLCYKIRNRLAEFPDMDPDVIMSRIARDVASESMEEGGGRTRATAAADGSSEATPNEVGAT